MKKAVNFWTINFPKRLCSVDFVALQKFWSKIQHPYRKRLVDNILLNI